jgi:hypothetical protein
MMPEDGPELLMIRHKRAQQILAIGSSFYWRLVQEGRIKVLGSGRASRADYASIRKYYHELLAEAQATEKAA